MRSFVRAACALLGLTALLVGGWALRRPDGFAEAVDFPGSHHFVHDVGAFQLGIGVTLLLAAIWADAPAVALAGYLAGGLAHTGTHLADRHLGGSAAQTWLVGLSAALAAVALVARWRELGGVLGAVEVGAAPGWAPFTRQKTVLLTSFRRDGTPVGTAVSIAVDGDRAYVRSFERAGKTRRVSNDPRVTVAPSTARGRPTGPAVEATARRLSGDEDRHAARLLVRKYPVLHGVLVPLAHRLGRRRTGRTVHFVLVTPPDRPA
ncbi:PPOX class F420-dependent oxidoreductase [Micromonospora purpureochromogenes]|uniref:PPOX class F420-dependent oxidoreductase n=1 Tax=Micromonospora purpureochromogenes TaxID=47872 RepID=UPI0033DDCD6D